MTEHVHSNPQSQSLQKTSGEQAGSGRRLQLKRQLRGMSYSQGQAAVQLSGSEPDLRNKHAGQAITNQAHGSTLFVNGVSASDVIQGEIADCYLMAALAAVAQQSSGTITSMIQQNGAN